MKQRLLWGLLLFSLAAAPALFVIRRVSHPAAASSPAPLPVHATVPPFKLTDQNNRPFDKDSLEGRVWVADFIFTSCAGTCPILTAQMAQLQSALPSEIHLVSFTVDPARDNPRTLRKYGARYGADPVRWHFLTGPENILQPLIQKGFRLSVAEGTGPEEPIVHSQRFVLVDRAGWIRGYYDSTDPAQIQRLTQDARSL